MFRAAIVALVALLALGGSSSANASPSGDDGEDKASGGRLELEAMLRSIPELDDTQRKFLVLVARGESGFNPRVGLGDPTLFPPNTKPNTKASAKAQANEAKAARLAYERNAGDFSGCDSPAIEYQFGSGGWFGMLPANGLHQLRDTPFRCWPPRAVFDPARSIVIAIAFARALQGWDGFVNDPTVYNLRGGWGNPSGMSKPLAEDRYQKFLKHAQSFGEGEAFMQSQLARFPSNYVQIYQRLTGLEASPGVVLELVRLEADPELHALEEWSAAA